ncbi:MAG: hypothetical protein EHM59_09075 [Betaproteobacteria bacterium]|nr:MAG: hypothetical protein EHM59_09075 [Betaproteobacteria bacterium]
MKLDARQDESIVQPRRRLLLGLGAVLTGCAEPYIAPGSGSAAPTPPRVATLDVQGRVDVAQAGRTLAGRDGMALYRGDEVRTFASTYAQVRFSDGDRVWLDYETRVRVGSIFTFFGRVFASVSGVFEVDSEFVAASSEGTQYTVTIGRPGRMDFSVAVRSGAVLCRSRRGSWRAVRLRAGQRLIGQGTATPRVDTLDAREQQVEFGWVPSLRTVPDRIREPTPRRDLPSTSTPPTSAPNTTYPVRPRSPSSVIERPEPRPPAPPSEPVIR